MTGHDWLDWTGLKIKWFTLVLLLQCGCDSGRHNWFKWSDGPQPDGTKTTCAICIYDLVLLSVVNAVGTDDFEWREPSPNSEACTRVIGKLVTTVVLIFLNGKQDQDNC